MRKFGSGSKHVFGKPKAPNYLKTQLSNKELAGNIDYSKLNPLIPFTMYKVLSVKVQNGVSD